MDDDVMTTCALFTPDDSSEQWQVEFERQFAHLKVQDWQHITAPEEVKYGIVWKPTAAFFSVSLI